MDLIWHNYMIISYSYCSQNNSAQSVYPNLLEEYDMLPNHVLLRQEKGIKMEGEQSNMSVIWKSPPRDADLVPHSTPCPCFPPVRRQKLPSSLQWLKTHG